ncbi:MAG: hypothetical protein HY720_28550 [Planctomycetes bacterium]|nr:hypothetical protein [Planctomycetota bacterium]
MRREFCWTMPFLAMWVGLSLVPLAFASDDGFDPEIVDVDTVGAVIPLVTVESQNRLYLLFPVRGLRVFDVSDRENPVLVGKLPGHLPGSHEFRFRDMAVDKDVVYMAGRGTVEADGAYEPVSVLIYDLSDPANPERLGYVSGNGSRGIDVEGDRLFLTLFPRGLAVYEWDGESDPSLVALDPAPRAKGIMEDKDRLYVGGHHKFGVYDVKKQELALLGATAIGGPGRRIEVDHDTAYVSALWGGLRIVDVKDPSSPAEVSSFVSESGWCWDSCVRGHDLFLAYGRRPASFVILDVLHPEEPEIAAELALSPDTAALSLDVHGDHAWVSSRLALPRTGTGFRPARLHTLRLHGNGGEEG